MNIELEIENCYEEIDSITTHVQIDMTPPPNHDEESDEFQDWLYDAGGIFEQTGTGHTSGNSGYFVKVLSCDDPWFVDKEFEFA